MVMATDGTTPDGVAGSAAGRLDYRLIGGFEVRLGDDPVDLGSPKQRAVLAILVLEAGRVVATDRMVELLWGDSSPKALASLQVYVSTLRKALEPGRRPRQPAEALVTQAPGYRLVAERAQIDVLRFEDLVARARSRSGAGDQRGCIETLDAALALGTGPLLPELADEPFVVEAASRLAAVHASAVGLVAQARLEVGDHLAVIELLSGAVAGHPLDERMHSLLARALYRAGRQADALRAVDRVRRALGERAGLDPGPELRALEADLLAQSPSLDWSPPAPDSRLASTVTPAVAGPAGGASGPGADPVGAPAPGLPPLPLVGRPTEVEALMARLEAAVGGRGGAVVVTGEPGIGKSRLLEEVVDRARGRGVAVAWLRCPESGAVPPYWPVSELVGQLQQSGAIDGSPLPAGDDPASGASPFPLYQSVVGSLRSATRPMLLVVDDVQWADTDSLHLLAHVAGELARTRALVAVTARPFDAGSEPALVDCLAALTRAPGSLQVPLGGLTKEAVTEWLAHRCRGEVSAEVADVVHERTEGHPLFVKELSELLASEGRLDDPVAIGAARAIPPGVHFVVRRRVSRLPAPTQRLLSAASVVGRSFDLGLAAAISDLSSDMALDALDPAVSAGLVVDEPDGGFRFSHALVADALAAEVSHARRARLHAHAALALDRRTDASAALVAHHALEGALAGTAELAVQASTEAARTATARLGHEDAALHWARVVTALGHARPDDRVARIEALSELAAAQFRVDRVDDAATSAVEAMESAEAIGDVDAMGRAGVLLGNPHVWPNRSYGVVDHRTVNALRRAADAVEPSDRSTRALLLGAMTFELTYADRATWDAARDEALDAARACGDPRILARVLMNVMGPLRPSQLADRRSAANEVLALVESGEMPGEVELAARFHVALAHSESAQLDEASMELSRCRALADRIGGSGVRAQLGWFGAAMELVRGRYDEAARLGQAAADVYRRTRRYDADLFSLALGCTITADRGGLEAMLEPIAAARSESHSYSRLTKEFMAWVLLEHGWLEAAAGAIVDVDHTVPIGDDYAMLATATMSLHVRAGVGDLDGVAAISAQLEPYRGRWASTGSGGCVVGLVDLALARGAVTAGQEASARRYFERAVAGHERLRTPAWLARSLLHQGQFLQRVEPDQGRAGREAIHRAAALAESHDLVHVARQAHEALNGS
jgi:DNA-binding SARP family transcriptional activator